MLPNSFLITEVSAVAPPDPLFKLTQRHPIKSHDIPFYRRGQTFTCDELEDINKGYLRADYAIECDSDKHKVYQIYAGAMILVSRGNESLVESCQSRVSVLVRLNRGALYRSSRHTSTSTSTGVSDWHPVGILRSAVPQAAPHQPFEGSTSRYHEP